MGDVTKETLNVAGLLTNVYARSPRSNPSNSSEPIVVLFFLHGRGENADSVDATARAAFAWADENKASSSMWSHRPSPRDFIVVTFVRGFLSLRADEMMMIHGFSMTDWLVGLVVVALLSTTMG